MKLAFCLLIASSIFTLSSAITPDPRFKHGCVALKQKIYCYGGGQYVSGGINYNKVLKDHLVLDLSRDFLVQDAQSAWTALSTPSNFTLEPNYSYGYTVLSPTSYLITSGSGYNDGKTYLKNKTTVYHADSNQWESVSTIANQSLGTTIDVDSNGNAYLFGGILTYTNTVPNRNLTTLNVNKETWTSSLLDNDTTLRADHASAMDSNGIIYYVGGRLGTASGTLIYSWNTNVPMATMDTFNTTSKTWKTIRVSGSLPTVRNGHSFTYVPKTNKFVLFGGKQGSGESPGSFDDICYTFDPVTSTWTRQNVAQIGSGSRFGHSAVLYMDTYLFIIFGADHVTMSMNSFSLLNLETWTWLDNFSATGHPNTTVPNNGSTTTSTVGVTATTTNIAPSTAASSSIGGGAIAGIVIGVVAFIGIVGAGLLFMRRRSRNNHADPPSSNYFSPTTHKFMNESTINTADPALLQQQQQRAYHLDNTSLASADSSTVPATSTSRHMQYKPDLSMSNFDHDLVKPHYSS